MDIPYIWYLVYISGNYGFQFQVIFPQLFNIFSLFLMILISRNIFQQPTYKNSRPPLTLFWIIAAAAIIKNSTIAFRSFGLPRLLDRLQEAPGVSYHLIDSIHRIGQFLLSPTTLLSLLFLWFCVQLSQQVGSRGGRIILDAGLIALISPLMMFASFLFKEGSHSLPLQVLSFVLLFLDFLVALIPPIMVLTCLRGKEESSS